MYKLSGNKLNDFLYPGSRLINNEGHLLEYVTKCNQLYLLYDTDEEEEIYYTFTEMRQLSGIKPAYYYCEFSHGENSCGCTEWQEVGSQRYLQLPAWDAVAGAMDWLGWDEMEKEKKELIFIKLWRSDHVLIGIFDADELEKISYGDYEPWEEL